MSDEPKKIADGWDVLGLMAIAFILGLLVGGKTIYWIWDVDGLRAKCVKAGVAEWELNPEDGTTKWKWKGEAKP